MDTYDDLYDGNNQNDGGSIVKNLAVGTGIDFGETVAEEGILLGGVGYVLPKVLKNGPNIATQAAKYMFREGHIDPDKNRPSLKAIGKNYGAMVLAGGLMMGLGLEFLKSNRPYNPINSNEPATGYNIATGAAGGAILGASAGLHLAGAMHLAPKWVRGFADSDLSKGFVSDARRQAIIDDETGTEAIRAMKEYRDRLPGFRSQVGKAVTGVADKALGKLYNLSPPGSGKFSKRNVVTMAGSILLGAAVGAGYKAAANSD